MLSSTIRMRPLLMAELSLLSLILEGLSELACTTPQLYRVSVQRAMTYNHSAMRLLFVADGRSPIAQNWIRYFVERGAEVYLASTFAVSVDFPLNGLEIVPVAFSAFKKETQRPGTAPAR